MTDKKGEINSTEQESAYLEEFQEQNAKMAKLVQIPPYLKEFQEQNASIAKMAKQVQIPSYLKEFQEQNASIAKLAKQVQIPSYLKEFQAQSSSIAKLAKQVQIPSYLKEFQAQSSSIAKLAKLVQTPSYLKEFQAQSSSIAKMAKLVQTPSYLKEFQAQSSSIAKMAKLVQTPSYLKEFQAQSSSIAKMAKLVQTPSYLKEFQAQSSSIAKMAKLGAFTAISNSFINTHKELVSNLNYIPAMAATFVDLDYETELNQINDENELIQSGYSLNEADKNNTFIQVFIALPYYVRLTIFLLFWESFMPILNSITANLLMPKVQEYIQSNTNSSVREINNAIKRIPFTIDDIDTQGLKFISRKEVSLRAGPSIKSEFLDELSQGQIISVLDKKKSWTKIKYKLEDDEIMQGWVLTRFTKKFIR
jgi:Asp-tRNA(Asn)/Glu-tRNA(Gln) amidotransferase C subunit